MESMHWKMEQSHAEAACDIMFASIGALICAEDMRLESEEVMMRQKASILDIEKMSKLGALLQSPGTTLQFQE